MPAAFTSCLKVRLLGKRNLGSLKPPTLEFFIQDPSEDFFLNPFYQINYFAFEFAITLPPLLMDSSEDTQSLSSPHLDIYAESYCPIACQLLVNIDDAYDESMTLWLLYTCTINSDSKLWPGLWDGITENNWIARCVYMKFLGDFYDSPQITY